MLEVHHSTDCSSLTRVKVAVRLQALPAACPEAQVAAADCIDPRKLVNAQAAALALEEATGRVA